MQFSSSSPLEDVQAYVASMIARHGGSITAQGTAVTSATFTKRFAWLTFIMLMILAGIGLIYLIWWFTQKNQSLTVTYRVQEGIVYGSLEARGSKAKSAAKAVVKGFTA